MTRWILAMVLLAAFAAAAGGQEDPEAGQGLTWKDLIGSDTEFSLYGFIRLDAMYDDSRMNDPLIPIFARSEDPGPPDGVPEGVVAEEGDDEFAMSARLTRLGLRLDGARVGALGDPGLSGVVEIDFYNIGLPDSDSRNAIRMRLAHLVLDWGEWRLLAGQDWDVIAPLYPAVNHDIVMWGSGNLGDRRPQLTARYERALGPGALRTDFGIALTCAVGGEDVVGGLRSGENSGRPMVNARIGYHGETGSGGAYQVGVWGHQAEEEFDATGEGEEPFESHSLGVDVHVPLYRDRVWAQAEAWTGENLRDVRGGILQGVNPVTGDEIEASGGWAEVGWQATDAMSLHAGYATDDPNDSDLAEFQRSVNRTPYLAARWRYGGLRIGLEWLHWTTEYVGLDDGDAHRVVGWIAYYF